MARNWLIVVIGISFGLLIGVLAPSLNLNASNEAETVSGDAEIDDAISQSVAENSD